LNLPRRSGWPRRSNWPRCNIFDLAKEIQHDLDPGSISRKNNSLIGNLGEPKTFQRVANF